MISYLVYLRGSAENACKIKYKKSLRVFFIKYLRYIIEIDSCKENARLSFITIIKLIREFNFKFASGKVFIVLEANY